MAAFLCLSLFGWSILPSVSHVPRIAETLNEHAQMIADHGHSHGFQEDLLWALHGHSHDAVDHDHSPALAVAATSGCAFPATQDPWRLRASQSGPHRSSGSNDLRVPDLPPRDTRGAARQTHSGPELFMPSTSPGLRALASGRATALTLTVLALYDASSVAQALAHNVTPGDAGYIQEIWGCISSPSSTLAPSTWWPA